jgi:hypothetical protein
LKIQDEMVFQPQTFNGVEIGFHLTWEGHGVRTEGRYHLDVDQRRLCCFLLTLVVVLAEAQALRHIPRRGFSTELVARPAVGVLRPTTQTSAVPGCATASQPRRRQPCLSVEGRFSTISIV